MPRLEHVQLLHPDDRARFGRAGIAASIQPIHLRADAADRAAAVGRPGRDARLPDAVARWTPAPSLAFGTDAPVEPIDPWPGLSMAVTRVDGSWPAGSEPFGPDERAHARAGAPGGVRRAGRRSPPSPTAAG